MTVLTGPAQPFSSGKMKAEAFLRMIETRPDEERWQLIDGEAFMTLAPPSGWHQRIAVKLERHLSQALAISHPDLDAIRAIGVPVEGRDDFRPVADLAVLPFELSSGCYFTGFRLAAEISSPSNTLDMASQKREFDAREPFCQYGRSPQQTSVACEVPAGRNGWQGAVLRSREDRIELPDYGFSCSLGDLYRGTRIQ